MELHALTPVARSYALLVEPTTQAHLLNACYQPVELGLQPHNKVLIN